MPLQTNLENNCAEMILDGPEGKPFTLDHGVLDTLDHAIESVEAAIATDTVRLLVIKSASPKFFCVGANINMLKELDSSTVEEWVRHGHRVFKRLEDLPIPTIAMVDGYTMGGGLELILCCDFIYAGVNAKFSQSEARLGFIPGWGATRRLPERIGAQRAKQLFYSGEMISGEQAKAIGLADQYGEADALDAALTSFEAAVCENSPSAIARFKAILNEEKNAARERNTEDEVRHSISCMEDSDTLQRVDAFLNRKK
jgi:enoyl-CoA hydratase